MVLDTLMPPNDEPGSFSTMKQVTRSSGVRANSITSDARTPLVTHILVPLMIHSSPSGTALQRRAPASLPESGSDSENAARKFPSTMRGRYDCFCSSVPYRPIMVAAILWVLRMPDNDIQPRDSSSMMRA